MTRYVADLQELTDVVERVGIAVGDLDSRVAAIEATLDEMRDTLDGIAIQLAVITDNDPVS